jgi:hypothetical protein
LNGKVSFEEALRFGFEPEMRRILTERVVHEMKSGKLIPERIRAIRMGELNVHVEISKKTRDAVRLAELRRHLIVHAGGIVDQRYLERSGDSQLAEGEAIKVTEDEVIALGKAAEEAIFKLASAVALRAIERSEHEVRRSFGAQRAMEDITRELGSPSE